MSKRLSPKWKVLPLGKLGRWLGGGTPSKANPAFWAAEGIPWVSPKDMKRRLIDDAADHITEAAIAGSATNMVPSGSILIVTRSGILNHTLPVAKTLCPVTINQDLKALITEKQYDPDFILYALQAHEESILQSCRKSGTTVANLNTNLLLNFDISTPPYDEQRRVVDKLDSLLQRSKSAADELAHIPRLVERYKQSILSAAFRGVLTAEWRTHHKQKTSGEQLLAELVECRAKLPAKRSPRTDRDLGRPKGLHDLPHGWTWCPVDVLASVISDGVHKKPQYVERGIPFLTVRNLTAGPGITFDGCRYITTADHDDFIKRTHPEYGDLLISKDGTLGVVRAVRTNAVFSIFVSVALVKPVDRSMTDYLELGFTSPQVQEQMVGVGTGLQHIHLTDLRRDFIPIAPREERIEIVNQIRKAFRHIQQLGAEAARASDLIKRLEDATLAKAFRGELSSGVRILKTEVEAS